MPLRVVHVYLSMLEAGGVETVLAVHHRGDRTVGLEPHFRMLFDRKPAPPDEPNYYSFNFRWWQPVAVLRRRFAEVMAQTPGAIVVHHNGWGLPFLASADASSRRVLVLHANRRFFGEFLPAMRGYIDGVVCVSPLACTDAREILPELEPTRVMDVPLPIAVPASLPPRPPERSGPLVLGYAGRLRYDQKRVDRIPQFLQAAREAGLEVEFEILGDGWHRKRLAHSLRGFANVRFLGWQPPAQCWPAFGRWDATLSFSDIEGGPITLLEGMTAGALPFFPRIGGALGDIYVPQVDPVCYYPPGDMTALARAVQEIFRRPPAEIARLRERARQLTQGHSEETYVATFARRLHTVAELPRLSRPPVTRPRPRLPHWLPLGFVTRAWLGLLRQS